MFRHGTASSHFSETSLPARRLVSNTLVHRVYLNTLRILNFGLQLGQFSPQSFSPLHLDKQATLEPYLTGSPSCLLFVFLALSLAL